MLSFDLPQTVPVPAQLSPAFADELPPVDPAFEDIAQRLSTVKSAIENVPLATWNKKRNRSKKKFSAISRSYHKMEELSGHFRFDIAGTIIALAEAPGGFLQYMVQQGHETANFYVMTLINDQDDEVPQLHPAMARLRHVTVLRGVTQDGDITNVLNLDDLIRTVPRPVQMLTADGGYNERDFNKKEQHHLRLIMAEFAVAIAVRAHQVVLKVFDVHTLPMCQLIHIACALYQNKTLCKPPGSRATNSEKYLVLSHFSTSVDPEPFVSLFRQVLANKRHVQSLFDDPIAQDLRRALFVMAETVLASQTESILDILETIRVENNNTTPAGLNSGSR